MPFGDRPAAWRVGQAQRTYGERCIGGSVAALLDPPYEIAREIAGTMSSVHLRFLAVAVGMIALSACAIPQTGMLGDTDEPYRLGMQALVANPPDYGDAMAYFRYAAIRNHVGAQRQLGRLYASVRPRPDYVRAYLWLYLASRSDAEAEYELNALSRLMTPEQIGTARSWAAGYVPGKAPDVPPDSPPYEAEGPLRAAQPNATHTGEETRDTP